jgi:hypothetical protein
MAARQKFLRFREAIATVFKAFLLTSMFIRTYTLARLLALYFIMRTSFMARK